MATTPFRIKELVITNFRAFRGEHVISLQTDRPGGITVFHGDNGSGKSTALAALELFFRAVYQRMQGQKPLSKAAVIHWNQEWSGADWTHSPLLDWPPGVRAPQMIELRFEQPFEELKGIDRFRITLRQAGYTGELDFEFRDPSSHAWDHLGEGQEAAVSTALLTPSGHGSVPFANVDTRRAMHGQGLPESAPNDPYSLLSPELIRRLYELKRSLDPQDKARWRAYAALLTRFASLGNKTIDVLRTQGTGVANQLDLHFEEQNISVLPFERLSSGEKQIVALCAAVLTAKASIVAIQEPELSLHPTNQKLLRQVLGEQVRDGVIDQLLLESHVPEFDGPEVVRFSRNDAGECSATSAPGQSQEHLERMRKQASDKNLGEQFFVTREGYTQLPRAMLDELGLRQVGGHVWFIKHAKRWEAWREEELNEYLNPAPPSEESK